MPTQLPPIDLSTKAGRARAQSEMMWGDHGFLRLNYRNLHQIGPEMWRAAQPNPDQIRHYRDALGIRTIVNLRGVSPKGYYLLEKEACEALGIRLIDFQALSRDWLPRERYAEAQAMFASIDGPALMHCKSGSDRAGIMAAFYQLVHLNRPYAEARSQLGLKYKHLNAGKTGVLDAGFAVYERWCADKGLPTSRESFLTWLETDFDPKAIKAGYRSDFFGNVLTELILRRE